MVLIESLNLLLKLHKPGLHILHCSQHSCFPSPYRSGHQVLNTQWLFLYKVSKTPIIPTRHSHVCHSNTLILLSACLSWGFRGCEWVCCHSWWSPYSPPHNQKTPSLQRGGGVSLWPLLSLSLSSYWLTIIPLSLFSNVNQTLSSEFLKQQAEKDCHNVLLWWCCYKTQILGYIVWMEEGEIQEEEQHRLSLIIPSYVLFVVGGLGWEDHFGSKWHVMYSIQVSEFLNLLPILCPLWSFQLCG